MQWHVFSRPPGARQGMPINGQIDASLIPARESRNLGGSTGARAADGATDGRADREFLYAVFAVVFIANVLLATHNWHWGFLIGHEFRQTQTAIISYYIDLENNFSVHYETPILGKPWEVPLEFPLYEWGVVWLSRITGRPHFESARTISLASVYLALPAIYLLLGRAALARWRRLLVLSVYLATPVYLFYGRTFLMDTTAMMFSAWFLAAFVETMQRRSLGWLAVCSIAGAAAGLVKSLTFFVWLLPAFIYGSWCLWSDFRRHASLAAIGRTIGWGFGAVAVPALAVDWWVRFTDVIKESHASAYIFTSKGLTRGNFGMYDLATRVSKETWSALLGCWNVAIANPWLIGAIVVIAAILFKRFRGRVLGAFALFIGAQMMFPNAYAYQDYYFTACAVFVAAALGFAMNAVFSLRLPRWCRWPLVLLPFAALYSAYAAHYFVDQSWQSNGGTGLATALRDYLPKNSVIIVGGSDWAAIIPYYSQHRALMIRNGLDADPAYLERAFNDLADEDVSALVLTNSVRGNQQLLDRAATRFNLDRQPTFSYRNADVYVSDRYRAATLERLATPPLPEGITFVRVPKAADDPVGRAHELESSVSAKMFPMVSPAPYKYQFKFGFALWNINGVLALNSHPDSSLWIAVPAGAHEAVWEFGIRNEAFERDRATDGVDFVLEAEFKGYSRRVLYRRHLDPMHRPADRGLQRQTIPVTLKPGESLVFRTGPHNNYAFDWCYWKSIHVQ